MEIDWWHVYTALNLKVTEIDSWTAQSVLSPEAVGTHAVKIDSWPVLIALSLKAI